MRNDLPDDQPEFSVRIETELVSLGQFRAVLVMLVAGENDDEEVRVPLAGEQPSAQEAQFAARVAIAAMARPDSDFG